MKKYIVNLLLIFFLVSCDETEKRSTTIDDRDSEGFSLEDEQSTGESSEDASDWESEDASDRDETVGVYNGDQPAANPETTNPDPEADSTIRSGFAGSYKKVAAKDEAETPGCNCNCIDLSFESDFDLCLAEDKIYITANCEKTGPNTADIYLTSVLRAENLEREIPWEKFDKNVPIATVKRMPDGNLELDWIGFSIDGELAVDYAIFGKDALEGTYNKT